MQPSRDTISGGGFYLLGVQALAVISITVWGIFSTFLLLWLVNKVTPLRMSVEDEILGADYTEHNISPSLLPQASMSIFRDGKCEEKSTSQGFALHKGKHSDTRKMPGFNKTYFIDELSSDRSKAVTHENVAYQHDEST